MLQKSGFKTLILMILDGIITVLVSAAALWIRFDFRPSSIPKIYLGEWLRFLPLMVLITVAMYWMCGLYRFIWRLIGSRETFQIFVTVLATHATIDIVRYALEMKLPHSVCFIELVLGLCLFVGVRVSLRVWSFVRTEMKRQSVLPEQRILLIGAGEAGRMLARELLSERNLTRRICCVIDDNREKWNKYLEGLPIIGGREQIPSAVEEYEITHIIFAIPSASAKTKKEILEICGKTGCRVLSLPGLMEMVSSNVRFSDVRDIQIEDLLGREPVRLNNAALRSFLQNQTVLVTGGGGSIGSELCRQIANYHPKTLIILDIYENNAYDIEQELKRTWGAALDLRVEIASVRDKQKIYALFEAYRPDIVLHAAAHKHVPLMETNPEEAIKNNIFGTWHVVRASEKFGTRKFVLISTDKAVNPTNFMGATKRFCELILQSRAGSRTEYCAVRFGNVLGSNGSVVPLFQKQIAQGGPVTVTDKRIIRYFMTIPEAAQLVLEAGAMAGSCQVFVLDMGEPVKILDLAENLIRLSGLEPGKDIEIREIGLRPGEKLYEELLIQNDALEKTANSKIFVEQQHPLSEQQMRENLERLDQAIQRKAAPEELIALLREMVPTYHDPESVNRAALEQLETAQV